MQHHAEPVHNSRARFWLALRVFPPVPASASMVLESSGLRPDLGFTGTTLQRRAVPVPERDEAARREKGIGHHASVNHKHLSAERTFIHKNLSQLPDFHGPPSEAHHFATTSRGSYVWNQEKPVGTPRHEAKYKQKMERTQGIFGRDLTRGGKSRDPVTGIADPVVVSTAVAMGQSVGSARRTVSPRFVHGGGFRNHSEVALDRNLVRDGAPSQDFSTTTHASMRYDSGAASTPRHKFHLPQKNVSTYMTTAISNVAPPSPAPRHADGPVRVGRQFGVKEFVTATDHLKVQGPDDRGHPLYQTTQPGLIHYQTSNMGHYMEHHGHKLVVPPGKGGVDMTRSTIPLGFDPQLAMETSHTHSMFTGMQGERRATCSSRGTLGTRL